jgi:hypothetical protein
MKNLVIAIRAVDLLVLVRMVLLATFSSLEDLQNVAGSCVVYLSDFINVISDKKKRCVCVCTGDKEKVDEKRCLARGIFTTTSAVGDLVLHDGDDLLCADVQ